MIALIVTVIYRSLILKSSIVHLGFPLNLENFEKWRYTLEKSWNFVTLEKWEPWHIE